MDLEIVILSEVRQRKTNIIRYHLYVESKKKGTNETYLQNKNRNRLIDIENKHGYQRGKRGRDKLGVWN